MAISGTRPGCSGLQSHSFHQTLFLLNNGLSTSQTTTGGHFAFKIFLTFRYLLLLAQ